MRAVERFRAFLEILPLSERAREAAVDAYRRDPYLGMVAVEVEYRQDQEEEQDVEVVGYCQSVVQ